MGSGKVWATGRELLSKHQHLLRVTLENKAANWLVVSAAMARGNTTQNPHLQSSQANAVKCPTSSNWNTQNAGMCLLIENSVVKGHHESSGIKRYMSSKRNNSLFRLTAGRRPRKTF